MFLVSAWAISGCYKSLRNEIDGRFFFWGGLSLLLSVPSHSLHNKWKERNGNFKGKLQNAKIQETSIILQIINFNFKQNINLLHWVYCLYFEFLKDLFIYLFIYLFTYKHGGEREGETYREKECASIHWSALECCPWLRSQSWESETSLPHGCQEANCFLCTTNSYASPGC